MRLICFTYKQFWEDIKNGPGLFILVVVGLFLSALAMIYFYGNASTYMQSKKSQELRYRTYMMYFYRPDSSGKIGGTTIYENDGTLIDSGCAPVSRFPFETVMANAEHHSQTANVLYISVMGSWSPKPPVTHMSSPEICALQNEDGLWDGRIIIRGRGYFTEDELNGEKVVIIPINSTCYVGDKIMMHGAEYTVIGQHNSENIFYIPLKTMIAEKYPIGKIYFYTKDRILDAKEDASYVEFIESSVSGISVMDKHGHVFSAEVSSPYALLESDFQESFSEMVLLCVLYFFSGVVFLILIKFYWDKKRYRQTIFRMLGAPKRNILLMGLIEICTLSLLANGFAVIFHSIFRNSLFDKINWQESVIYHPQDYMVMLGMMMLMTLLFAVPFILIYNKKTLGEVLRSEKEIDIL